jgi:hypothetical protein
MNKQDLFFTILEDFVDENYNVPEGYEMTKEEAYIVSILLDYFEENYKVPTLEESLLEDITGYDVNAELYEEIMDVLMDESVGTFVAGAAHGIKNYMSSRKLDKATKSQQAAKVKKNVALQKAKEASKAAKSAQKDATNIIGNIKAGYKQGVAAAKDSKAGTAMAKYSQAEKERKSAAGTHQYNVGKTKDLANRIDTGISNVKNRVKSALNTGAARVSGIMGKAIGMITR